MPSAAAERKIAPMLVWFVTFSSTATRVALSSKLSGGGSAGRLKAASAPRVRSNPVSARICSRVATKTGSVASASIRRSISGSVFVSQHRSTRTANGSMPAPRARSITFRLADEQAFRKRFGVVAEGAREADHLLGIAQLRVGHA